MAGKDFLNQFTQQLGALLDEGNTELRQQVRAAAQAAFERMDLVSREEFDAQRAVLLRTREKLEALEAEVTALEARLDREDTGH